MALPDNRVTEYAKDMLERTLDDVIKNTIGDKVSQADFNRVSVVAQIEEVHFPLLYPTVVFIATTTIFGSILT